MSPIDLRSDTVTRPSRAMLDEMMRAEVGDDVLGDDPTVLRLQEHMAELLGKEAALYVPSGTMANQVAIRAATEPGDEIILDETTHCHNYETGGPSALSGCSIRSISGARGVFSAEQVEAAIRPESQHFARTRMVVVENTNNRGGGTVWPVDAIASIAGVCAANGLHLHLDGARLMNACVAAGRRPQDYTRHVASVSTCFSKGLGAPVGSIVAGGRDFIRRAHRFRKMFGGAMRQAGVLAAAALYAIRNNVERLAEDHAHARRFAERIAQYPGIRLDPRTVETNIVIFDLDPRLGGAPAFCDRMKQRGLWMLPPGPHRIRAVTHLDVSRGQIDQAADIIESLCAAPVAA